MLYVDFIENVLTRADHTKQLVVVWCGFGKIRTFEKAGVLLRHIHATVVFVNNAVL